MKDEKIKAIINDCKLKLEKHLGQSITVSFKPSVNITGLNADIILTAVTEYFKITPEQLAADCNKKPLPFARQLYCYCCRKHTKMTYDEISEKVGYHDPSSSIGSRQKFINFLHYGDDIACNALYQVEENIKSKLHDAPVKVLKIADRSEFTNYSNRQFAN